MLKLLQNFALFVVEALSTLINCLFLILALNRIFPDLVEFLVNRSELVLNLINY